MAREIVTWCDRCLDDDQRSASKSHRVSIDGYDRLIDLCPDHAKEYLDVLRELIERVGQRVETTTTGQATTTTPPVRMYDKVRCGICNAEFRRQYMNAHAATRHDGNLSILGEDLPAYRCGDCGNFFTTKQGLTMHTQRVHSGADPWAKTGKPGPKTKTDDQTGS